ncbi:YqjF family protein [Flavobacterium sp. C4GT6]|uniref:YqjF family protein n=1 Tax=Flavobacterium sp. C4GT6 TaxID=3103818 RepID=UPI002ECFF584
MKKTFLNAQWRKLVMINYAVDPKVLEPYVPFNTELDLWNGTCYVSLIGFMFVDTKVLKLKIPFHINFEEINLRFYVKYKDTEGYKRGVVFIKEIVPRPALTLVANMLYKENYETLPTRHNWIERDDSLMVEYGWKKDEWNSIRVTADKQPVDIVPDSEEEFITEHFWGYTKVNDTVTSEYEVAHPRWQIYPVKDYEIDVDFAKVYGSEFAFLKDVKPVSVYLAEGSDIVVKKGKKLKIETAGV